jgi:hypothetical protein
MMSSPGSVVPQNVYDAYWTLHDHSQDARYGLLPFTDTEVRDLLDQELATVAAFTGM